jgi:hypothetical protein
MDTVVDWLARFYASFPLLFWVLGSVSVYVLGRGLLWLVRSRSFWHSPYGRFLAQVGRFLFHLGIPYLALGGWPRQPFQGLLSLDDMGLVGFSERWPVTRWLESAGTGLGVGLVALSILALARAAARRNGDGLRFQRRPWWQCLLDVIYLEVHWAFYRGALSVLLQDLYTATFVGLGLVYLEWGLDPFWRNGWRLETRAARLWLQAALALVASLIFLLTRNLWVCLGVHLLLGLALSLPGARRVVVQAGRSDSIEL